MTIFHSNGYGCLHIWIFSNVNWLPKQHKYEIVLHGMFLYSRGSQHSVLSFNFGFYLLVLLIYSLTNPKMPNECCSFFPDILCFLCH